MAQVYFDDKTNQYFYYGDNELNEDENNSSADNNIKPVPNAKVKRGAHSNRRKQNTGNDNDATNIANRNTRQSLRNARSKYSGESDSETESESESETDSETDSESSSGSSGSDDEYY